VAARREHQVRRDVEVLAVQHRHEVEPAEVDSDDVRLLARLERAGDVR
jgi:hypothetical protein